MLMGLFERTPVPGAPYLLACVLSLWAFLHCFELPLEPEQVSRIDRKLRRPRRLRRIETYEFNFYIFSVVACQINWKKKKGMQFSHSKVKYLIP